MKTILIIGVCVFPVIVLFLSIRRNRRKALSVDKNTEYTSHVAYGITKGEYIICSNCKYNNRVGIVFNRAQIRCEGCGQTIVLRGNDKEKGIGDIIDAEFNRYDMKTLHS